MEWFRRLRKVEEKRKGEQVPGVEITESASKLTRASTLEVDISPNDPLLKYISDSSGLIEVDKLDLESPALKKLKDSNVKLSIPLISQGELIGLLNLGPRLSEADYSTDDRRLLSTLSTQAAPALRVAQLARQQQIEARERERIDQELRVARVIQQTLLPKEVPQLPGWHMAAYWQPARAVSGDFYDFIHFSDGRLGIVVADVTDKGVPAALVMATTRSILRSTAERLVSPGIVLEQANNALCPNIPMNMFVTCLYALLDPSTGGISFANAGHNVPYRRTEGGVAEMRARGMPLGLFPDMKYEQKETVLTPGENAVFYSDGLVEAHNPQGEMFGYPRLRELLGMPQCGDELIQCLLGELNDFTGPGWEQEDDVTFVTLERLKAPTLGSDDMRLLAEFELPSEPGNELRAVDRILEIIQPLELPESRKERIKTAVAETTMNAMEHGNRYRPDLPVEYRILTGADSLHVFVTDYGGGKEFPEPETPSLEAKLAGTQLPRGWGLFLIKHMVDELEVYTDETHHTVELVFNNLEGVRK